MTEKQLHKQICDYIKMQYPKLLFNTDMSGIKLTMGQAIQAKNLRSNSGFPDIVIYKQSNGYGALFIEVKIESPYMKNDYTKIKKNKHIESQIITHCLLESEGYKCEFAWSFDMAKKIIDWYLK